MLYKVVEVRDILKVNQLNNKLVILNLTSFCNEREITMLTTELYNYALYLAGHELKLTQSNDEGFMRQYFSIQKEYNKTANAQLVTYLETFQRDYIQSGAGSVDVFIEASRAERREASNRLAAMVDERKYAFLQQQGHLTWVSFEEEVARLKQDVVRELERRGVHAKYSSRFYSAQDLFKQEMYTSVDIKHANMSVLLYNFFPEYTETSLYDAIGLVSPHLRDSKTARVKLTSDALRNTVNVLIDFVIYSWVSALLSLRYFDELGYKLAAILSDEVIFEGKLNLDNCLLARGAIKQTLTYIKPIQIPDVKGAALKQMKSSTGDYTIVTKCVQKAKRGDVYAHLVNKGY